MRVLIFIMFPLLFHYVRKRHVIHTADGWAAQERIIILVEYITTAQLYFATDPVEGIADLRVERGISGHIAIGQEGLPVVTVLPFPTDARTEGFNYFFFGKGEIDHPLGSVKPIFQPVFIG